MKIGLIVYSQSGHTLEVCQKLRDRYIGEGHDAIIDPVTVVGERTPQTKTFELEACPDPSVYDAVVFASSVEAFSLCPVMARYMKGLGSLNGKKTGCLVTQQFPYPWMGGNRAIKQMKRLCQSNGANVRASGIVNWAKSKRERSIAQAVYRLGNAF